MSARCEDYPCCGHEEGDCPDKDGRFLCVGGCGRRLPKNAKSSICPKCTRRLQVHWEQGGDFDYSMDQ